MAEIKPIETRYKGHRFRSRLEARWAVFFDTLGIKWEYEPEGFELSNGMRYLPDFYLPSAYGHDWYVEIKPEKEGCFEDLIRCATFSKDIGKPVMILGNIPSQEKTERGILYAVIIRYDLWGEDYVIENYPLQKNREECELLCCRGWCMNNTIGRRYGDAGLDINFFKYHNHKRNLFSLMNDLEIDDCGWAEMEQPDFDAEISKKELNELNAYINLHKLAYEKARSARFEFGEEG